MDTQTLNLILWAPFCMVVLLSGLRFAIQGWKRGIWVALLNLGITLAAAAIAVPIAKLALPIVLARLSVALSDALPAMELSGGSVLGQGLPRILAALLLFPLIFFLLALVARLTSLLLRPLLSTKKAGPRAAGLVVGTIHAVVYPLLLLLPLYGTLAVFAPTVSTEPHASVLAEHPVVRLAATEPAQWYYGNLSTVEVAGTTLDAGDIAAAAEGLLVPPHSEEGADRQEGPLQDLILYLKELLQSLLQDPDALQKVLDMGAIPDLSDLPIP